MIRLTLLLLALATPALAHHEAVVAVSAMPLLMWLAALVVTARVGWRLRRARQRAPHPKRP